MKNLGLVLVLLVLPKMAMAVSATAQATANVVAQLAITTERDLTFGELVAGSSGVSIPADPGEERTAKFLVAGQPNAEFDIILPGDDTVTMITNGGGSPETTIAVNSFASFPAIRGIIQENGTESLFVGATSADLLAEQAGGAYAGDFVVEVLYP